MIKTKNLTKIFNGNKALDDVTIDVKPGELFGLVGPDGAGKTTILRILATVLQPTSGEAFIAGASTAKQADFVREKIAYMSQRFGLYEDLTVLENINFYADIFDMGKERMPKIDQLLKFSGLTQFKSRLARDLSGGMKQKLGLSCALIHTPEVLLLDEPTSGVDPVSRREFWKMLHELLSEGITILISTSYLDEAERCNRIALMYKGGILVKDTPLDIKKLLNAPTLEEAFIEMIKKSQENQIGQIRLK